ncbi:MAG: twin-arginine translocase subunit TatC [Saprospiraceae bacterium]|nr:twin-arginine translocase subunit TatC [Saprospiraceae bacterium]
MAEKKTEIVKHEPHAEMTFLEHLEVLRWHIIRSLVAIALFGIVMFLSNEFIFDRILFGPKYADFPTYGWFCPFVERMCDAPVFSVQTITIEEKFMTHLKVSIILGIVVAFPYIIWEIWSFVKPGLYAKERNAARGIVWICSFLFLLGISFGYYIITPFALKFLTGWEVATDTIVSTPTLTSYVSSITFYTLPSGIVFEMPIVVYFLTKIGLMSPEFMRQYRRMAIVIILIVAGIITPPDVLSQFLVGIPLFILYEVSIIISKRVIAQQEKEEAAG